MNKKKRNRKMEIVGMWMSGIHTPYTTEEMLNSYFEVLLEKYPHLSEVMHLHKCCAKCDAYDIGIKTIIPKDVEGIVVSRGQDEPSVKNMIVSIATEGTNPQLRDHLKCPTFKSLRLWEWEEAKTFFIELLDMRIRTHLDCNRSPFIGIIGDKSYIKDITYLEKYHDSTFKE